jgi:alkanesulfonate monooxygenase SsuD/methylene tetrahydromethanopterin reductase-like flavin-dependent oxidoreductase (luciferase family)
MGGYNIDPPLKRPMWREGLEVALRCMTESPFTGYEGTYVSMPPRNVVPKPVQKPHPPLWVACSRRETIRLAAQAGIGALTFAFIDPEEARTWVRDYERTLAERCVPIGKAVNPQVACVTPMMLHRDEHTAIARGLEGGNFFGYSLSHYYLFGDHRPGRTNVWEEFQQKRHEMGYDPEAAVALQQERLAAKVEAGGGNAGLRGAVGTPEQLRDYLQRYEEAGVDQVIFVMQAGKNRHEHIMEALELFGKEVLPEFKARDERRRQEKAARLAPVIEAAIQRRVEPESQMPRDYVIEALHKPLIVKQQGVGALEKIALQTALGGPRPRLDDLLKP